MKKILCLLLVFSLFSCSDKKEKATFDELHRKALSVKPEDIGVFIPKPTTVVIDSTNTRDRHIVYGIVMDWISQRDTITTVAYSNGEAAIYYSDNDSVISGKKDSERAALKFIETADEYAEKQLSVQMPLRAGNTVAFHILTDKGILSYYENGFNFSHHPPGSELSPLLESGNQLYLKLRNPKLSLNTLPISQ